MRNRAALALMGGLTALVVFTGCANSPAAMPPAAPVSPAADPAVPPNLEFGQTYQFTDGLTVTVPQPVIYRCAGRETADEYCTEAADDGSPYMLVNFEFVNTGSEIIRGDDVGAFLPRFAGLNGSALIDYDPALRTTTFGDEFLTVSAEAPLTPGETATEEALFQVSADVTGTVPVEVTWDGGDTGYALFFGDVDLRVVTPTESPSPVPAPGPAPEPGPEAPEQSSGELLPNGCPEGDPACDEGDLTDEEYEQYVEPEYETSGEAQFEYGCEMGYITEGC